MTVDELKLVLDERFKQHERRDDAQHAQIISHFDKLNGTVAEHDKEITAGKIRDAWWAGGVVAAMAVLKMVLG